MNTLQEQIQKELQNAMKERSDIKREALRGLITAITNELVAQKKKPKETLPDEDVMKVIKRQVKQRKDSIEQYKNADRPDLVKEEGEELKYLETYLPPEMGREEIKQIVCGEHIDSVIIYDDLFTVDRDRVIERHEQARLVVSWHKLFIDLLCEAVKRCL